MKVFSVEVFRLHRKIIGLHARPEFTDAFGTVRSVDTKADDYLSSVWMFPGGDGKTKKERTHV